MPGHWLKHGVNDVGGVLSGWPTDPEWWRGNAASLLHALAASRSLYTCGAQWEAVEAAHSWDETDD